MSPRWPPITGFSCWKAMVGLWVLQWTLAGEQLRSPGCNSRPTTTSHSGPPRAASDSTGDPESSPWATRHSSAPPLTIHGGVLGVVVEPPGRPSPSGPPGALEDTQPARISRPCGSAAEPCQRQRASRHSETPHKLPQGPGRTGGHPP